MAFNNIDAPGEGNRRARRAVAVIQRKAGAEGRKAAAQAKRQRKMARSFERDLGKTIVFYAMPEWGFVSSDDPDGAYLSDERNGQRQIIVSGELRASVDHYVNAINLFLKASHRLVESRKIVPAAKPFTSIIVERANAEA